MSKIDKELGMEEMMGMFDADKLHTDQPVKKEQAQVIKNKKPNQTAKVEAEVDLTQANSSPTSKVGNPAPAVNNKEIKRTSRLQQSTKISHQKKRANTINDSEESITNKSIYDRLKSFSKEFARGHFFTSVRILKKKKEGLSLLFPELSTINIIDNLITDYLIKNREKLRANMEKKKQEL